jgi:hypothetical protein
MRNTDWAGLNRPLTDEERSWLTTREMFDVVDANDRKFEDMGGDEDTEEDTDKVPAPKDYSDLSADDLRTEVKTRQEAGRDVKIVKGMKKADVAAMLVADDAAQAAEEDE